MKKVQIILSLIISACFIYFVFQNIDFSQVREILMDINYVLIVPAVVVQLASYWVRSMRWAFMLRSIKRIKSAKLFPIICISYMANNVLPLRIGEFVRAFLVGKKERLSKTGAFSTILLERIYDGLTLLLFLGATAILFPFPAWVKRIGFVTAIVFCIALLFVIGLVIFKNFTLNLIKKSTSIFGKKISEKLNNILEQFVIGLDVIKDKKSLIPIAFFSLVIWMMEGFLFFSIAQAFDYSSTIYLALFVLVVVNLGIMIPSSPGYVGTFEYFCTKALGVFNVTKESALSYALVLRIFQYIPITVLGFFFLLKEGISLSQMVKQEQDVTINSGEKIV
jgi:conserved hypothetical protein